MNPFLATDGYKVGHHKMYPLGTTLVYSNFTPRSNKYAPTGCNELVSFGQQMVMRQIKEMFDVHFFMRDLVDGYTFDKYGHIATSPELWEQHVKNEVCQEIQEEYSIYLGTEYDVSHIEELWDLGFLPIEVKALPEGSLVPMGVPVLTIWNTDPDFYWLTNFLETLISNLLWKPMTSATIANQYRKNLTAWANKTDREAIGFVDFQGHDFSMRGLDSIDATISSGLGHATSFLGSDSLPVIHGARKYYDEEKGVVHSVNATEHSVMCAGTKGDEIGTFRYLMKQFPTGILSVVSDTWDLWKVLTEYLPELKEEILERDGKIVIRPDSGNPVDIICGYKIMTIDEIEQFVYTDEYKWNTDHILTRHTDGMYYPVYVTHYPDGGFKEVLVETDKGPVLEPEATGVIELLWNIFGGIVNEQGYKVLDPHIGAIYGDSITIDRAEQICQRLEEKGFASTNIVLGVGSFTYQYNTRDTFGFAMKATYVEITKNVEGGTNTYKRPIFKDPITDDGTKKSAKGLLMVGELGDGTYELHDEVGWKEEDCGALKTIFRDGYFFNKTTLTQIRSKLKG